jgi:hypothetical protein
LVNAVARRSPIDLAGRYIGMLQQRDVTSRLSSKNGYRAIGSHVLLGNICLRVGISVPAQNRPVAASV